MYWVFIIGIVLSLVALLFTFEAIVGEKERGTLKLVMAQSLPRHTLLLGKFLGAMLVLSLVMILGVVVNLLLVLSLSEAHLGAGETVKLVGMVGLAVLYLSIFVSLGLWISVRSSSARASLVSVLLLWTCTSLIWPQTGGVLAARLLQNKGQGETPITYKKDKMVMGSPTSIKMHQLAGTLNRRNLKNPTKVQPLAEAIRADRRAVQQIEDEILADQLNQAEFARNLVRLSPMGCFQYGMEALAGTGLARHKSFIEQVRTYAQSYEQTIIALDRADPESMHLFPVPQAMSKREISVESLPVFREDLSVATLISQARVDVIILCFLAVITYLIAYRAWLRSSVL
ncbi:MAG: ABC transporter permease subunit [Gemmatimonadetes bacterium]|nr:ABC transporter permease subunit [Gemmatimonadota bacterium]